MSLFTDKVYSNSAPKERLLLVNENGMIVDDSEATTTGAYLGLSHHITLYAALIPQPLPSLSPAAYF